VIRFSEVRLRPMESADKDRLLGWRNSERVRAGMYTDHVIGAEEHERWLESALRDPAAVYRIFEYRDCAAGFVSFTAISRPHRRCHWAFYLGETDVPRGTGAAMEFLALSHAFEILQVDKLCCEVFAFNSGVLKLHEKFGFVEEGRLARHYVKNGRPEDVVCLAKFRVAWEADKPALFARCFDATERVQ
jgi:UDP-4-amino-4,6-dideoxy-N-acetyl-beta-L-altrosamine N-acetyltransferase